MSIATIFPEYLPPAVDETAASAVPAEQMLSLR
jgi:hypothetical protein